MKKYIPSEIEPKWQKKWAEDKSYQVDLANPGKKYYVLAEFAYPSGDLHMGHWFTWGGADIFARFKRMQGYNVFFPNGFDAFGLPAENAAIKRQIHPQKWTLANIESMKKQYQTMGASFEFDHGVVTCLPEYYKWNQWIFLKMYEKGVAYKGKSLTNWCPVDQTVLADEQVVGGFCERCGAEVTKKEIDQWFLKITSYADRLIWDERGNGIEWPKSVMEGQNNWIGRSIGVVIKFDEIEIFTTRQDTLFGATFVVISPEHPLLSHYVIAEKKKEVNKYLEVTKKKSELERKENKEKTGIFTGSYVKNPITGENVPVWVADYVLAGYGTGAVMGVPAHDERDYEFAKKYGLGTPSVISLDGKEMNKGYEGEGILINSGEYNGMSTSEACEKISDYLEKHNLGQRKVNYHLHDWSISRQRYWGTPIPIIHCDKCGIVPVPEKDLPVELPYEVDYTPKGEPPLATNKDWLNVKCPKCGGMAKRDTNTMDGFFDNSWYFFRYLDNKNDKEIFRKEIVKKWLPIEIYFGGAEHTLGHTLYSRFFTKFLFDVGLIEFEEYAKKRVNHGIVLGPDGEKMSKSRGNVVNPDDQVKEYGADSIRVHMAFFMPYEGASGPWIVERVGGSYRFLQRIWGLQEKVTGDRLQGTDNLRIMHKTIKKVSDDIENIKFNTAIASLMEWLNYLSRKEKVSTEEYKTMLSLLAPFAPHITEELWSLIGEKDSIHKHSWPEFDNKYIEDVEVTVAIQINGKVRDTIVIQRDMLDDSKGVEKMAIESKKIQKFLIGKSVKKVIYIRGKIISLVV